MCAAPLSGFGARDNLPVWFPMNFVKYRTFRVNFGPLIQITSTAASEQMICLYHFEISKVGHNNNFCLGY